jgi:hypothetical protein
MANYFDKFDPKPAPRGGGVPARGPAPGFSDTPELRGRQVQASTGQSQAATGKTLIDTKRGELRLPFEAGSAEAEMRGKMVNAQIGSLKLQKARGDLRTSADQAKREADEIVAAAQRVLSNKALPEIVGRSFNPMYGMFGHYDLEKDTGVTGQPRLFFSGSDANTLNADMEFLQRKAYIQGRQSIAKQGSIQAGEAIKAAGAEAVLDPRLPPIEYAKRVMDFKNKAKERSQKYAAIQAEERKRAISQGLVPPEESGGFKILSVKPVK